MKSFKKKFLKSLFEFYKEYKNAYSLAPHNSINMVKLWNYVVFKYQQNQRNYLFWLDYARGECDPALNRYINSNNAISIHS